METAYAADFILAYELEMYLGPKNGAEAYYANEVYITSSCKKMIHIDLYLCEDTICPTVICMKFSYHLLHAVDGGGAVCPLSTRRGGYKEECSPGEVYKGGSGQL